MNTDKQHKKAVGGGALAVECGDLSPLFRGDLSPSRVGAPEFGMGRSRLAPARACGRGRALSEVRRRQVAYAKAVTSHRTPNWRRACRATARLYPSLSVFIRGSTFDFILNQS